MSGNGKKRFYLRTFGCQMNHYDSERLAELLAAQQFEPVATADTADLIFINTCSVRDKAEQKAFSFLGRLKGLKKRRPSLVVAMGGCVAQRHGSKLLERVPHLDLVVGTHGLGRLPEMLARLEATGEKQCWVDFSQDFGDPPIGQRRPLDAQVSKYVTIMRGCDNFCTYCVVPWVRGRECSRGPEEIVDEVQTLVRQGVREVVLLGQNVNSYGKGLSPAVTFAGLLHRLDRIAGLRRIRFTTSHPKDLSADLIRCFQELPRLCPHIHLPVQSGSNRILARMHRGYTREQYLELVAELRRVQPEVAISSDIIVGFPGEEEQDFNDTLDLVERVRFDALFSFKYSDRPPAAAASFADKIPEAEKLNRLQTLQRVQERITMEKNRQQVGQVVPVLVEGYSSGSGPQLSGRTPQNRVVNFTGPPEKIGQEVLVRIEAACAHSLRGSLVDEGSRRAGLTRETQWCGK